MAMEDFKRPNHPDFMDSSELRKIEFSGIRHNSISAEAEIWVMGEVKARVTAEDLILNPQILEMRYAEVFGLNEVNMIPRKGN